MMTSARNYFSDRYHMIQRADTSPVIAKDNNKESGHTHVTRDLHKLEKQNAISLCDLELPGMYNSNDEIRLNERNFRSSKKSISPSSSPNLRTKKKQLAESLNLPNELSAERTYQCLKRPNNESIDSINRESTNNLSVSFKLAQPEQMVKGSIQPSLDENPKDTNLQDELSESQNNGKGRMAKMTAKAVSKASVVKNKLQRSNSSAQVQAASSRPQSAKNHRVRSTSAQRETESPSDKTVRQGSTSDRKERSTKRAKRGTLRGVRSRSVTSPRLKQINAQQPTELEDFFNAVSSYTVRATIDNPWKIHTANINNSFKELVDRKDFPSLVVKHTTSNSRHPLTDDQNQSFSQPNDQSTRNKKQTHRKLRRNNSSLNYTAERFLDGSSLSHSSAGDLVLPMKDVKFKPTETANTKELTETKQQLKKLFNLIENDNVESIIKGYWTFQMLVDKLKLNSNLYFRDIAIGPVEFAVILASPLVVACLILIGVPMSPILQKQIINGPGNAQSTDPIKDYLKKEISASEDELVRLQSVLERSIALANESILKVDSAGSDENEEIACVTNSAFTDVTTKEHDLMEYAAFRDKLVKLHNGLNRFSSCSSQVRKVRISVTGSDSITISITPPALTEIEHDLVDLCETPRNCPSTDQSNIDYQESDSSTSLDASDYDENIELTNDKMNLSQKTEPGFLSNLILRYRIEWTYDKTFNSQNVFHHIVDPPIYYESIYKAMMNRINERPQYFSRLFRTGYYTLTDLEHGREVFIRVYTLSIRGWSKPRYSEPISLKTSSWTDFESQQSVNHEEEKANTDIQMHVKELPFNKFVGTSLNSELRTLKQQLDQQLFLWMHRQQPSRQGLDSNSLITATAPGYEESSRKVRSPQLQRKKSFRFLFSTKSVKFSKQAKSGVYLCLLCHTYNNSMSQSNVDCSNSAGSGQLKPQLLLSDENLPLVNVTKQDMNHSNTLSSDINWFSRLVCGANHATDLQLINEYAARCSTPSNTQFRLNLLNAWYQVQLALGCSDTGVVYPEIYRGQVVDAVTTEEGTSNSMSSQDGLAMDELIDSSTSISVATDTNSSTIVIALVKRVTYAEHVNPCSGLKWCSLEKFIRHNRNNMTSFVQSIPAESSPSFPLINSTELKQLNVLTAKGMSFTMSPEQNIIGALESILNFSEHRSEQLSPGLYIALIQMHAKMDQKPNVLISNQQETQHMVPVEKVRRRSHVTYSEWYTIKQLDLISTFRSKPSLMLSERRFIHKLSSAWTRLSTRLNFSSDERNAYRIYRRTIIQLSPKHSFILILPPHDLVCLPPNHPNSTPTNCSWIPVTHFERGIGNTYDHNFHSQISALHSILDLLVPMSLYLQRQCLDATELADAKERNTVLRNLQEEVNSFFLANRWVSDVISNARDKKREQDVCLKWSDFYLLTAKLGDNVNTNNGSDYNVSVRLMGSDRKSDCQRFNTDDGQYSQKPRKIQSQLVDSECLNTLTTKSAQYTERDQLTRIFRVYIEFPTKLGFGTSVKLMVNLNITVRDMVDVIIKTLSESLEGMTHTRRSHSSKQAHEEMLKDPEHYCLLVETTDQARYIPDRIRPVLLPKPWSEGRLSLHLKSELNRPTNAGQEIVKSADTLESQFGYIEQEWLKLPSSSMEQARKLVSAAAQSTGLRITTVRSPFHYAKVTLPPVVHFAPPPPSPLMKSD